MTSASKNLNDRPLTISALLHCRAEERGDYILHVCDDEKLSYAQAESRSRTLACGLLAAGANKGTHVALLYPTGVDFIVGMLAAARIGAVAVPLSTLSTADELRWLLSNSDSVFLLAAQQFRSQQYVDMLQAAFPELDYSKEPTTLLSQNAPWLKRIWFSDDLPSGFDAGWSITALEQLGADVDEKYLAAVEARVNPADRFAILHTSGSTGTPKGVMHTHGNLITHLFNTNEVRCYKEDDIFYSTFPWFWIAGFAFGLIGTLVAGGRIVHSNATAAADILDFIERERPTMTNGFWRSVIRLSEDPSFADRDFSFLRRGNLYPILFAKVRPSDPGLRHDIYGMSETGGGVALDADERDLPEYMRGACGRFLPTYEAKIVDLESGEECAADQPGELWLRSPLMAEGYYGKPRSAVYQPDGWYRTNDIGVIDKDGYFYLRGRTGDMIKTAGVNVAPREVEAVLSGLMENLPCVVLGIPDKDRDQLVAAVVITEKPFDEEQLRARLAQRLSSYKVPKRILRFTQEQMPVLSTGKYELRKLTTMVQEHWNSPAS